VPGYVGFLALLGLLLPAGVLPLRLGQAAVLALGVLPCHALGSRLGGPRAGLAAALVYALDPLVTVSASLLYPDAPAALLLAGALVLAWDAGRQGGMGTAALAGIMLGALTTFRLVALALAPAMLAGVALMGQRPASRRARLAGSLIVGWLLVLGPWAAENLLTTGHLLPVAAALRSVPEIGADAERVGVGEAVVGAAARNPAGFARRALREFGHFWEPYPTRLATDQAMRRDELSREDPRLSAAPLAPRGVRDLVSAGSYTIELLAALLGLWVCWRRRRLETVWLLALVLSFAVGYAIFYGKLRYRIPVLPVVFAFAGVAAARAAAGVGRRQPHAELPPTAPSQQKPAAGAACAASSSAARVAPCPRGRWARG